MIGKRSAIQRKKTDTDPNPDTQKMTDFPDTKTRYITTGYNT
jgi:hypothetical protein